MVGGGGGMKGFKWWGRGEEEVRWEFVVGIREIGGGGGFWYSGREGAREWDCVRLVGCGS